MMPIPHTPHPTPHAPPATAVRMGPFLKSRRRPAIDPFDFVLQPGGRWHRVLTPLATGALTVAELLRATDPGHHPRKVERLRIHRALLAMERTGLIESAGPWGWTATARGRAELDALTPSLTPTPTLTPTAGDPADD